MNTYGHHSQGCKGAGGCFYYKKRVYLISGCPGFPGDTVAVKELIGGLVEMQESHQFGHTGFRDGVISCSLWVVQNSYGAALTGVHCWLNVKQRTGNIWTHVFFSRSSSLRFWDFSKRLWLWLSNHCWCLLLCSPANHTDVGLSALPRRGRVVFYLHLHDPMILKVKKPPKWALRWPKKVRSS